MELMFSSQLISWVMVVPRKRKDTTVSTGESHRMMGVGGAGFFWKSTTISTVELQVVLTATSHQMVNLSPVGGLIPTRDEPNEGGVVHKLQELDRLMTGGAGFRVQGEE